jgi:arginine exporter protein ArgO
MLTGPCRPWGFRLNETLFPGLAEAVQVLLRHFRDMSSTSLFDFLDPSTVEWWEGRRTQHLTPFAITGIFSAILLAFVAGTGLGWKAWALPTALSVLWWFGCTFLGASVVFSSESRWVRFRRALQFIATSPVITRKYKPQTRWRNLWWLAPTAVTVIRLITLPSEGAVGTLQIIVLVGALAAIIVWLQKK